MNELLGPAVPSMWGLFQAIQGLVDVANLIRSCIVEAARLLVVHHFLKDAIQHGIFDIKLV